ncbi:uncharacterized protein LOC144993963 isoform X2 [Oryzias latipes]
MAGRWDFASCALSAGVLVAGLLLIVMAAFPVVQISIGAAFMHECPAAPLLPIYVLVFGIWVMLMMVFFTVQKLLCSAAPARITWTLGAIFILLLLLWILFGSYQVYSIYPPNYQKNETNLSSTLQKSFTAEMLLNSTAFREGGRFCNRSLYLLAFWSTTLLYVLAGSTLLGMLCMCACMKGVEVFVQHLHS